MRVTNWLWRYLTVTLDDSVRVQLRRGNWGVMVEADFWCGEMQVRLGRVGLHVSVATYDTLHMHQRNRASYWSGVRLYAGKSDEAKGIGMRLVDSWEREIPVEDMWPHLGYTYAMESA